MVWQSWGLNPAPLMEDSMLVIIVFYWKRLPIHGTSITPLCLEASSLFSSLKERHSLTTGQNSEDMTVLEILRPL